MKKIFIVFFLFGLVSLVGGLGFYFVKAATTNMDVSLSAGALSVTSSGTSTLSGLTVSTSAQTATGTIASVNVIDTRGSGAGWSVVITSQHFTTRAAHKNLVDVDNDGISGFTGVYDGLLGVLDPPGTFIVEITASGTVGVAVFQFTDPLGNTTSSLTTAATSSLNNGIVVDWDDGVTYDVGDKFSAAVDLFPYTGLTVTPGSITANSGTSTSITAGSTEALTGSDVTSAAKTLMAAAVNSGFGDFSQAPSLSLSVHANSLSGSFVADATITVS